MRRIIYCILLAVLALSVSAAADNRFIVQASPINIGGIAARYGLTVAQVLDGANQTTYLLTGRPDLASADLQALLGADVQVWSCESDSTAVVTEVAEGPNAPTASVTLPPPSASSYFGSAVLGAYLSQPATSIIRLWDEQSTFRYTGKTAIVAVIDSGVDPGHAALQSSLLPGYDFVNNLAGTASEFVDVPTTTGAVLNQSTSGILDKTQVVVLNQSTSAILDQSTSGILDTTTLPAAFGHGTMVAGIVHLTAPDAQILPLKAFHGDGTGQVADIVRAVYYATQNGARVINMSFSMSSNSPALQAALNDATSHGVICVASAGNTGQAVLTYPGALNNVIGVGSTSNLDQVSTFSTYGSAVNLGAPGEQIITTYPGQNYAAGWGTSFSTPFVSGEAALLIQKYGNDRSDITYAMGQAKSVNGMGRGRISLYKAFNSN